MIPIVASIVMVFMWPAMWVALKAIRARERATGLVDSGSGPLAMTTGVDDRLPTWAE